VIPTILASTPGYSSNQSCFHEREFAWWGHPSTSSKSLRTENVKAFSQVKNSVNLRTPPIITYNATFTSSIYVFRAQEWFNQARDDVLRSRKTPPLVRFFVGNLVTATILCSKQYGSEHSRGRWPFPPNSKGWLWSHHEKIRPVIAERAAHFALVYTPDLSSPERLWNKWQKGKYLAVRHSVVRGPSRAWYKDLHESAGEEDETIPF
jgi:hypothetical protein